MSNERDGNERGREVAGGVILDPRTYRTQLVRADVAALVGDELGEAPGGDPVSWELRVDTARVAVTDEPMTDHAAVWWARRLLGEGVVFLPARLGGGYWVAHPETLAAVAVTDAGRIARTGRGWA